MSKQNCLPAWTHQCKIQCSKFRPNAKYSQQVQPRPPTKYNCSFSLMLCTVARNSTIGVGFRTETVCGTWTVTVPARTARVDGCGCGGFRSVVENCRGPAHEEKTCCVAILLRLYHRATPTDRCCTNQVPEGLLISRLQESHNKHARKVDLSTWLSHSLNNLSTIVAKHIKHVKTLVFGKHAFFWFWKCLILNPQFKKLGKRLCNHWKLQEYHVFVCIHVHNHVLQPFFQNLIHQKNISSWHRVGCAKIVQRMFAACVCSILVPYLNSASSMCGIVWLIWRVGSRLFATTHLCSSVICLFASTCGHRAVCFENKWKTAKKQPAITPFCLDLRAWMHTCGFHM